MDRIIIENLEVFARHGVFPEENVLGQKFLFSLTLWTDTRRAGISDALEDSVNYGEVCHLVQEFATSHTFRLLEALAENLVEELLIRYPSLSQVDLTIRKPWAPVGLPLESVGVAISRKRHLAFIALGSNMGDRRGYLDGAVRALRERRDCRVLQVSDYLVTEPYGGVEQEDFLNGALSLETFLSPEELLDVLHEIEAAADRRRKCAGDPGRWIWISCCTTIWCWIFRSLRSRTGKCTCVPLCWILSGRSLPGNGIHYWASPWKSCQKNCGRILDKVLACGVE